MSGKEEYDQVWLEENHGNSFEKWLQNARINYILSLIEKYKPKTIMEIGPGLNPIFPYVKHEEFKGSLIIEPSKIFSFLIYHNKKNKCLGVKQCKIEDFTPSNTYDMIIISSVLHEVEKPLRFLLYVKDHCNKDTIVHINVPNSESFHRLLGKKMGILKSLGDHSELGKKLMRQNEFNNASLTKLLWDAGFKIINYGSFFFKPFSNKIMESIINEEMFDGLLKIGKDKKFKNMCAELYFNVRLI